MGKGAGHLPGGDQFGIESDHTQTGDVPKAKIPHHGIPDTEQLGGVVEARGPVRLAEIDVPDLVQILKLSLRGKHHPIPICRRHHIVYFIAPRDIGIADFLHKGNIAAGIGVHPGIIQPDAEAVLQCNRALIDVPG